MEHCYLRQFCTKQREGPLSNFPLSLSLYKTQRVYMLDVTSEHVQRLDS